MGRITVHRRVVENDLLIADLSLGFDWQVSDWLPAHAIVSEGVTFVYPDNVPGKRQVAAGVRITPFVSQSLLENLGVEVAVLSISFPHVDETLTGLCSIFSGNGSVIDYVVRKMLLEKFIRMDITPFLHCKAGRISIIEGN